MINTETKIFPIVKRFQDVKMLESTVILKTDMTIHEKCFREGTVFFVLGWREINSKAYLIMSRGSWEGLVNFDTINHNIEATNGKR